MSSGISKLCYLKEIFYQLGHQETICLEAFPHIRGKANALLFRGVSFWDFQHI